MATYTLTTSVLTKLCAINQFSIPGVELVLFGIRGSVPVHTDDYSFQKEIQLNLVDVDYTRLRCTMLQWKRSTGQIASFPGSTVPYIDSIKTAKKNNGAGTNCMITSYVKDFKKGIHKGKKKGNWHEAFVQTEPRAYRRSADNFSYDNNDRVEYENPGDNLHAAWTDSLDGKYSSEGCQVILGMPKCANRIKSNPSATNTGAWAVVQKNAYAINQISFPYVLLTGYEVMSMADRSDVPLQAKLRFGSSGPLVQALQNKLKKIAVFTGNSNGDFDGATLRAVLKFQQKNFGNQSADGIVGPNTASALGLNLPMI